MALKKAVVFKGANAEYWKIISETVNWVTLNTDIQVGLYVNKIIREQDINNALVVLNFHVNQALERDGSYIYLKTLPEFDGTEDC